MDEVAKEVLSYVDYSERIVQLASSWHRWLHHYSEHHIPQDYGMGILNFFITANELMVL
ncbi:hypothetical protein [Paenibacillus sp. FSL R7-0128]|uniref:hypothetical protein n=1 Tax=Paenibacillus sp. FSL R7-0128 TaxID=2954529 RepID=UPI0030F86362